MAHSRSFIVVSGPTGVGKSLCAYKVAKEIGGEIVNGDMGQFYVPLTIGTAKPAWRTASSTVHHLFDCIGDPTFYTAAAYRDSVATLFGDIWARQHVPMIVGGSLFYISALFFPPIRLSGTYVRPIGSHRPSDNKSHLWERLYLIDPVRAKEIDPGDIYRVERALDIWERTGVRPSLYKPLYDPIARFIFVWLERDRDDLYERINQRVIAMIKNGWIDEVRELLDTPWEEFLLHKKIIGYPDVILYCRGEINKEEMVYRIQKKTRNYAKRQMIFWRRLRKMIKTGIEKTKDKRSIVTETNLTHIPLDRYIKQLKSRITHGEREVV